MVPIYTKLEDQTREEIDKNLEACGWVIQDKKRINLFEKTGVAVREMDTDTGLADYIRLYNCLREFSTKDLRVGQIAAIHSGVHEFH